MPVRNYQHPEAARATNTQQTWRQEFFGSRSATVERASTRTAVAVTFLRFFQTIFENTSLWRLKRLVTLSTYRCYINKCIYLSMYLPMNDSVADHGGRHCDSTFEAARQTESHGRCLMLTGERVGRTLEHLRVLCRETARQEELQSPRRQHEPLMTSPASRPTSVIHCVIPDVTPTCVIDCVI